MPEAKQNGAPKQELSAAERHRRQEIASVSSLLDQLKPQLARALPRHLTPERLLRVTLTAVQNNPKLLECDRRSFMGAVMTCAQLGLEPDGVLGQAYLVPFKNQVQFIPGYKGLIRLARNSGEILSLAAYEVCENDFFEYSYGLNETLKHTPADSNRGEVVAFYAYAKFVKGGHHFEVMSREQVEAVRDNSEGYKAYKAGRIKTTPWADHFVEMGRKTVIRRIAKYLPMEVQRAAAIDAAVEDGKRGYMDDAGGLVIEGEAIMPDEAPEDDTKPKTGALDDFEARHSEGQSDTTPSTEATPTSSTTIDPETGEVLEDDGDSASAAPSSQSSAKSSPPPSNSSHTAPSPTPAPPPPPPPSSTPANSSDPPPTPESASQAASSATPSPEPLTQAQRRYTNKRLRDAANEGGLDGLKAAWDKLGDEHRADDVVAEVFNGLWTALSAREDAAE